MWVLKNEKERNQDRCYLLKREGRIRKVVDMGHQCKLYDNILDSEWLQYEIVNDGSKKNKFFVEKENVTIAAFATWAKEIVND